MQIEKLQLIHQVENKIYGFLDDQCYTYDTNFDLLEQTEVTFPHTETPLPHYPAIRIGKYFYGILADTHKFYKVYKNTIKLLSDQAPTATCFSYSIFKNKFMNIDDKQNIQFFITRFTDKIPMNLSQPYQLQIHYYMDHTYLYYDNTLYEFGSNNSMTVVYQFLYSTNLVYNNENLMFFVRDENKQLILLDLKSIKTYYNKNYNSTDCVPLLIINNHVFFQRKNNEIEKNDIQSYLQLFTSELIFYSKTSTVSMSEMYFQDVLTENSALQVQIENLNDCVQDIDSDQRKKLNLLQQQQEQHYQLTYAKLMQQQKQEQLLKSLKEINELQKYNHHQLMNKYVLNGRMWEFKFEKLKQYLQEIQEENIKQKEQED